MLDVSREFELAEARERTGRTCSGTPPNAACRESAKLDEYVFLTPQSLHVSCKIALAYLLASNRWAPSGVGAENLPQSVKECAQRFHDHEHSKGRTDKHKHSCKKIDPFVICDHLERL